MPPKRSANVLGEKYSSRSKVVDSVADYMQYSRCFSMSCAMPQAIIETEDESDVLKREIEFLRWKTAILFTKEHVQTNQVWTTATIHHINCLLQGIDSHDCKRDVQNHIVCPAIARDAVVTLEPQHYFSRMRVNQFIEQYALRFPHDLIGSHKFEGAVCSPAGINYLNKALLDLKEFVRLTEFSPDMIETKQSYARFDVKLHLETFRINLDAPLIAKVKNATTFFTLHQNYVHACKCVTDVLDHLLFDVSFEPWKSMVGWRDLLLPVINMDHHGRSNTEIVWSVMYLLFVGSKTKMFCRGNSKMLRILVWAMSYKWDCSLHFDVWTVKFWSKMQWHLCNASTDYFTRFHMPKLISRLQEHRLHVDSPNLVKKTMQYDQPDMLVHFFHSFDYAKILGMEVENFESAEFVENGLRSDLLMTEEQMANL